MGFNSAGDSHYISHVGDTKFFLYFFTEQQQANTVVRRAFGFHHILTDTVYDNLDEIDSVLSFDFMEVNQHSTAMLACRTVATDVVKKCLNSTKLEEVKAMLLPLETKCSKSYSPTCNHGYFTRRVLKYLCKRKSSSCGKKTRVYCCHHTRINAHLAARARASKHMSFEHAQYLCTRLLHAEASELSWYMVRL